MDNLMSGRRLVIPIGPFKLSKLGKGKKNIFL